MSAARDLEDLPAPGSLISGKYEVVRLLGRGGMGVVVQARHLRMEKDVALKILLPALRDQPEVVARFEREGRAAAQLQGEHVARVLDVDTLDDGSPFIAMELLRGKDLADILHERGQLTARDAVGYVLEACSAMADAHRLGIVHRDLKPNNLFVDQQGERPVLKVLDFGISKVTSDVAASMTATATAFGTPLYMSPEQVRSAKNVDGRADIWSLGVVLYELLTGVSPFAAEGPTAILAAIIADAPVPIAERRPDLPAPLAAAIMRALEKQPAARFPNVESFAAAIAPFGPAGDGAGFTAMAALSTVPEAPGAPVAASTHVPAARVVPARGAAPLAPIAAGVLVAFVAGAFIFFMAIRRLPPHPAAQADVTIQAPSAVAPSLLAPVVQPVASVTPAVVETATAQPLPVALQPVSQPRPSAVPAPTGPRPAVTSSPASKVTPAPETPRPPAPPARPTPDPPPYL
jgi:serine/threonine-protein kinase